MTKLLAGSTPADQIRAILRTEYGWTDERIQECGEDDLHHELYMAEIRAESVRDARTRLPEWIQVGLISADKAATITDADAVTLLRQVRQLDIRASNSARRVEEETRLPVPAVEQISRGEVLSLAAELLSVVAVQQVEIASLREEIGNLRASHIAVFGRQAVIEQLTSVDRDFEGFEANLELIEEASASREVTREEKSSTSSNDVEAADTHAAIQGLASYIAGLDVGRVVNRAKIDRTVKRLSESAKERMKARVSGKVHVKIGKVTRGKPSREE